MGGLLVVALLAVFCINFSQSAVLDGTLQQKLRILNSQITVLDSLLNRDCPHYTMTKREDTADLLKSDLTVRKLHYELLRRQFVECKKEREAKGSPITIPTGKKRMQT